MAKEPKGKIEILLVEDNPGDARLVEEALKEAKMFHNLHWVPDGEEAMAFVRRQGRYAAKPSPDLIILDLNLPRKDGREVLAELKQDPTIRSIPVVVFTTSRAQEDILRAYNLHANCYVQKPVDLEQLVAVVKSIENFWFTVVTLPHGKPDYD